MKKSELVFSIAAIVAIISMIGFGFWRQKVIDLSPLYVLAKVYNIQNTENGLIYSFKYYYINVEYGGNIKGFVQLQDSTILLRIAKANPQVWQHIEGRVAKCLTTDSLLKRSWSKPPLYP